MILRIEGLGLFRRSENVSHNFANDYRFDQIIVMRRFLIRLNNMFEFNLLLIKCLYKINENQMELAYLFILKI